MYGCVTEPFSIPVAPTIRLLLVPSSVPQGATPTFVCEIAGNPLPVILEWRKDNDLLTSSSKRIRILNDKSILVIHRLSPRDGGLYECFAEAGGLRLNASTWLRVIGASNILLLRNVCLSLLISVLF